MAYQSEPIATVQMDSHALNNKAKPLPPVNDTLGELLAGESTPVLPFAPQRCLRQLLQGFVNCVKFWR